jgi:hypothetical protein
VGKIFRSTRISDILFSRAVGRDYKSINVFMNPQPTNNNSYILHAIAGIIIVAGPMFLAGIPDSWQSMTIGGVLAMAFKWAHDFAGY